MRRWRVEGVDKDTGEAKNAFVVARTEGDARSWGWDQNMLVSDVKDAGLAPRQSIAAEPVSLPYHDIVRMANARGVTPDAVKASLAERVQVAVVALDRRTLHSLIVTIALGLAIGHVLTIVFVFFCLLFLYAIGTAPGPNGLP
jgi:tetrahydromethanopterin S-methyltransferase subunit F